MSTFDDDPQVEFFEEGEPATLESPRRPPRRIRPQGGGQRRTPPPPGAVALARLAGLVALAIAVIVGLVFWVGACQGQSKRDEYSSYIAKVRPLAQDSAQVGAAFANELGAANLTLAGFEAKLEQWSQQEQRDYAAAQRIVPPGPLQTAHQQVLDTMQLRAVGLAGLANTLAQANSSSGSTVAADLATEGQLLSASDIVWTQLFRLPATATLKRVGVTGVIAPPSQFVTNPDIVSNRSFAIVYARLSSTSGGGVSGLHGSALTGAEAISGGATTTLSTTTTTTVSFSSSLVIRVSLVDSGNFPEVKIPVTLSVVVTGRPVYSKTVDVRQIVAKQQETVSFTKIQVPTAAFGSTSSIKVSVGKVPGETNVANNKATYPVLFSLAAG